MDKQDFNRERSHIRKREAKSMDDLEKPQRTAGGANKPNYTKNLHWWDNVEEILYADDSEQIHQLVSDSVLSDIISRLTPSQKRVLNLVLVQKYKVPEAAEILGVTPRNVLKHYKTALHHIRGKIYPIYKFRRKLETVEEYQSIAKRCGIYTTLKQRAFLEKAGKETKCYYGEMTGE